MLLLFIQSSKTNKKSSDKSRAGSSKAVRFAEVDLNEDSDAETADLANDNMSEDEDKDDEEEEEEEEGDPSEFIDVLDILDGRGEPESEDDHGELEKESSSHQSNKHASGTDQGSDDDAMEDDEDAQGLPEEDEDEDGDDDEEDEQPLAIEADDDSVVDDSALQNLEAFIGGLDAGTKRKAPDDADAPGTRAGEPQRQKRRVLKEQTQVGVENEFAALSGTFLSTFDLGGLAHARRGPLGRGGMLPIVGRPACAQAAEASSPTMRSTA